MSEAEHPRIFTTRLLYDQGSLFVIVPYYVTSSSNTLLRGRANVVILWRENNSSEKLRDFLMVTELVWESDASLLSLNPILFLS